MGTILFIDQADFIGGAELFLRDVVNHWPSTTPVVLVCSPTAGYRAQINSAVKICPLVIPRWTSWWNPWVMWRWRRQLRQIVASEQVDAVFSNTVRTHLLTVWARLNRPLVWYLHDTTFPRWWLRWVSLVPTKLIANSQYVAGYYRPSLRAPERLVVVPNGVLPPASAAAAAALRYEDEHGRTRIMEKKSGEFWILAMGRIDWWKGFEYLIEAVRTLPAAMPWRVVILGKADPYDPQTVKYAARLYQLVKKYGLQSRITWVGWQPTIDPWLARADLLAHTAVIPEPFGRVIIEAMVRGVPVVATQHGGPLDIIEPGVTGALYPPRDSQALASLITQWWQQPAARLAMGEAARQVAQTRFSLDTIVAQLAAQVILTPRL